MYIPEKNPYTGTDTSLILASNMGNLKSKFRQVKWYAYILAIILIAVPITSMVFGFIAAANFNLLDANELDDFYNTLESVINSNFVPDSSIQAEYTQVINLLKNFSNRLNVSQYNEFVWSWTKERVEMISEIIDKMHGIVLEGIKHNWNLPKDFASLLYMINGGFLWKPALTNYIFIPALSWLSLIPAFIPMIGYVVNKNHLMSNTFLLNQGAYKNYLKGINIHHSKFEERFYNHYFWIIFVILSLSASGCILATAVCSAYRYYSYVFTVSGHPFVFYIGLALSGLTLVYILGFSILRWRRAEYEKLFQETEPFLANEAIKTVNVRKASHFWYQSAKKENKTVDNIFEIYEKLNIVKDDQESKDFKDYLKAQKKYEDFVQGRLKNNQSPDNTNQDLSSESNNNSSKKESKSKSKSSW